MKKREQGGKDFSCKKHHSGSLKGEYIETVFLIFFNISIEENIGKMFRYTLGASLVAQMLKNMPIMQELQVWFQGQEDPLEEEMATQSCIQAWEIPREESDGLQSVELQRVRRGSVQFGHSVVSDSLWPHGLQHAGPPFPSSTPGAYWNLRPSSWWDHPTISSSVVPFSSHLQSYPASGPFPMSQFFASGGQWICLRHNVIPMRIRILAYTFRENTNI